MKVIWAEGFDYLNTSYVNSSNDNTTNNNTIETLGLQGKFTSSSSENLLPNIVLSNSTYYLRGLSGSFRSSISGTQLLEVTKQVEDNDKCVLSFMLHKNNATNNQDIKTGLISTNGKTIQVSIQKDTSNISRITLYINNTKISNGNNVNFDNGEWVHVALFIDKINDVIKVICNGTLEISENLNNTSEPFVVDKVLFTGYVYNNYYFYDDIVYYIESDPVGILKVDGYLFTGTDTQTYNDSKDNSSSSTNIIKTMNTDGYRSTATTGTDLYSYNNILPAGVEVENIYSVNVSTIASKNYFKDTPSGTNKLKILLNSDTELSENEVDNSVKSFLPSNQTVVFNQDPKTNSAWTKSAVQAIKTGYKYST